MILGSQVDSPPFHIPYHLAPFPIRIPVASLPPFQLTFPSATIQLPSLLLLYSYSPFLSIYPPVQLPSPLAPSPYLQFPFPTLPSGSLSSSSLPIQLTYLPAPHYLQLLSPPPPLSFSSLSCPYSPPINFRSLPS